ncbi:MAG: RHS repeat-associated core domain-containing protein, partial [Pseudomonadota bacterium]
GQRVQKETASEVYQYVYDRNGLIIGEYSAGGVDTEYIYLNGIAVLQFTNGIPTYLHSDHIGTPRIGTGQSKLVSWSWAGDAFGQDYPDEDPVSSGTNTTVNLRFPGQFYDQESGAHYNYWRSYVPGLGRYDSSDPIGLAGGMNPFTYSLNNPLRFSDPLGLRPLGHPPCAGPGCTMNNQSGERNVSLEFSLCGVVACAAIEDGQGQVSLVTYQVGVAVSICIPEEQPQMCEIDADSDGLPDRVDDIFPDETGAGNRFMGVSVKADGSLCLNIGVGIGSPVHISEDFGI